MIIYENIESILKSFSNHEIVWLHNQKIKFGLNDNDILYNVVKFLNIQQNGTEIEFLFGDKIYSDLELKLTKIGIDDGIIKNFLISVEVKHHNIPTTDQMGCSKYDPRDFVYHRYKIRIKLELFDKYPYLSAQVLGNFKNTKQFFVNIFKNKLDESDNPYERAAFQNGLTEIENMTSSYISGLTQVLNAVGWMSNYRLDR